MRKSTVLLSGLCLIMIIALMTGCAGMAPKPSESNFKAPVITLSHIEVEHYYGYWYFSNKVEPTKGKAGNYGAPLDMAFIFEIENPNSYPIRMDNFKYSILFDEFEVNTVSSSEAMWIPSGKTNAIRIHAMFDTRQTLLTLLLPGAVKLKEKKMSPWDALEKWWTGAPEFSFPITVKEGSAVFTAEGITKVVPFESTFP